jgi:hypothetical protein
MENMEFLKAMLAKMNAKMDANIKEMQEMLEKQIGSLVSIMEAPRNTDRDKM